MKVLVTGHRGYIGVEMVPELRAAGHEVVGLDTGLYDERDFISPPDEVPNLDVDLRTSPRASQLEGSTQSVPWPPCRTTPLGDDEPDVTYDINLHASVAPAKAAKTAGVRRFLFSSSCSLYGAGGDAFLDETAPFHPVTPYGDPKSGSSRQPRRTSRMLLLRPSISAIRPPTACRGIGCVAISS